MSHIENSTPMNHRPLSEASWPPSPPQAVRKLQLATMQTSRLSVSVRLGDRKVFPYLTTLTDRFTNSILGTVIEPKPPTNETWIRCLERAMAPKSALDDDLDVPDDARWRAYGIPRWIEPRDQYGADGAAFRARCAQLGIRLVYTNHESELSLLRELVWLIMPDGPRPEDPFRFDELDQLCEQVIVEVIHRIRPPGGRSPAEEWGHGQQEVGL